MDFSFNEEQQMLQDMAGRFFAGRYGFEARNRIRESGAGWSRDIWNELAELGLLAIAVPEADGGIGAGGFGALLVAQAAGAGLLLEPFVSSAIVATTAVARSPEGPLRSELLAALAAGERIAVLAGEDAEGESVLATRDGDGWKLEGDCEVVYHAPLADVLLVPARDEGRLLLFAVPAAAPGLSVEPLRTVDDQVAGNLRLRGVAVAAGDRLSGDAEAPVRAALESGLSALCADALGSMERALAATIEYSKSRVQFGVPIGRFQALQHRMADMLMQVEQARSMACLAAASLDEADARERARSLSAAKALIGQAGRQVAQQSVQLHGGMGMTDELDVSHHFRRLLAFEARFGATDVHLRRYRELA